MQKPRRTHPGRTPRRVNFRLFFTLLAIVAACGVSGHFLHAYQMKRNADAWLRQARASVEQENWARAATLMERYLLLRPADVDARIELGQAYEQLGGRALLRAFMAYEDVLRRDPTLDDVRRNQATLAIRMRRFPDAQKHLQELLKTAANDGELWEQMAVCLLAAQRFPESVEALERAIKNAPDRVTAYERLIDTLAFRMKQQDRAAPVLDRLARNNPKSVDAWLVRAEYFLKVGDFDRSEAELQQARRLDPKHREVVVRSVHLAMMRWMSLPVAERTSDTSLLDTALASLEAALAEHPEESRFYLAGSQLEVRRGRVREAVDWLERGLQHNPGAADMLFALADLQAQLKQTAAARATLERFRKANGSSLMLKYLEARLLIDARQYRQAIQELEEIRSQFLGSPELQAQLETLLGQCHEATANPDRQLECYTRAIQIDPLWIPARVGHARALAAVGRVDEAIAEYRELLKLPAAAAFGVNDVRGMSLLGRMLIAKVLRMPRASRNWDEVNAALENEVRAYPDELDPLLVYVDALTVQNRLDEAARWLDESRARFEPNINWWESRAALATLAGDFNAATALLAEAEGRFGDTVPMRLMRGTFLVRSKLSEAPPDLERLLQDREKFPLEERVRLMRGVAEGMTLAGKTERAIELWQECTSLLPDDLSQLLILFDMCLQAAAADASRLDRAEQVLAALKRAEGNGSYAKFCQAQLLLVRSKRVDQTMIGQARKLLTEVEIERPLWPRVHASIGEIEDVLGRREAAVERYLKSVNLGHKTPTLVRRAAQLLFAQKRFVEANDLLRQLEDATGSLVSGRLGKLGAEVALEVRDWERAVTVARNTVRDDSSNVQDRVWLGQVLDSAGKVDEAEAEYRKAIELAPSEPETWVSLVLHYTRRNMLDEARKTIDEAVAALPPEAGNLVSAQCYEIIRQDDRAESNYVAALARNPNDPKLLRTVAEYYLRTGRTSRAQDLLQKLISPSTKAPESELAWGRRMLAAVIANGTDYGGFLRGLELINLNLKADPNSRADLLVKARLLATRTSRLYRGEAISLFEQIEKAGQLGDADRFTLYRLHELQGNWAAARQGMHSLLPVLSRDPRLLGEYVAALLRHDDVAQAEVQLSRLEQLAPQSFSVIMHRARLLVLQRSYDAALAEIQRYVGKPQLLAADALQRKKQAAALAEELGMLLDRPGFVEPSRKFLNLSETLYREYMQERPSEVLAFAMFLNRRGRTEEALAVCEEALQTNPAEAVAPVGIAILRQSAAPTADQLRRIEGWITAALRRQGNQESLRLYLADLRDLEGKYGDAEQLYREVLATNPRNVLAMNNLAWFLAAREPGNPEAAQLIDTALKITGPNAELLDTRGFVYYQMGEFQAAANDFEEATSDAPNAVKHFHLAQAFDRLNRRNDAVAELKKARELGLRSEQLHPLEREEFRKLSIALQ